MEYVFQDKNELQIAANMWCDADKKEIAISTYGDIGSWDVSNITDMSGLFKNKPDFDDDITNWDITNVTNINDMFLNTVSPTTSFLRNLSKWNILTRFNITDWNQVFSGQKRLIDHYGTINEQSTIEDGVTLEGIWSNETPTNLEGGWVYTDKQRGYHCSVVLNGELYVIGGENTIDGILDSVKKYNPITNIWVDLTPIQTARTTFDACVLNGEIYIYGGETSSGVTLDSVEKYNTTENKWTYVSPMKEKRKQFGSITFNGKIYVVCGHDGSSPLRSTESYSPETNEWTIIANHKLTRYGHAVTYFNGEMYIMGGTTGGLLDTSEHLYYLERHDMSNIESSTSDIILKGATYIPNRISTNDFSIVALNGYIYIVGGTNKDNLYFNTVERYSPIKGISNRDGFETVTSMSVPRAGAGAIVLNGKIFVVFGRKQHILNGKHTYTDSIESYSPHTLDISWNTSFNSKANLVLAVNKWCEDVDKTTAISIYGDIKTWDVGKVEDMSNLFKDKSEFDEDIVGWDVSAVTDMTSMFDGASSFSYNLRPWSNRLKQDPDVLTENMFKDATTLLERETKLIDTPDVDLWDTYFFDYFKTKEELENVLEKWMTTQDKSTIIHTYGEIDSWDVSKITDMSNLFHKMVDDGNGGLVNLFKTFHENIINWDVSAVTDMTSMFEDATTFDYNLHAWENKLRNDVITTNMFKNTTTLRETYAHLVDTPVLSNWEYYFLIQFSSKQQLETAIQLWNIQSSKSEVIFLYGDVSIWDVSKITDMSNLFRDNTTFNENIEEWDISTVTNMNSMFEGASLFEYSLKTWSFRINPELTTEDMFKGATKLRETYRNLIDNPEIDFESWNYYFLEHFTSKLQLQTMIGLWIAPEDYPRDDIIYEYGPIEKWDVSQITDMSNLLNLVYEGMEKNAFESFNEDISEWDVSNVTDMTSMFEGAESFNQNLRPWWDRLSLNTENIKTTNMFKNTPSLVYNFINLVETPDTSKWYHYFTYYFRSKNDLQNKLEMWLDPVNHDVLSYFYEDISEWNVSMITDMSHLFHKVVNGINIFKNFNDEISEWDVTMVTNMSSMFEGAERFDQNIEKWNTSNVIDMSKMFKGAERFDQNINTKQYLNDVTGLTTFGWDVSKVIDISEMFYGARRFNYSLDSWDVRLDLNTENAFKDATFLLLRFKLLVNIDSPNPSKWKIYWKSFISTDFIFCNNPLLGVPIKICSDDPISMKPHQKHMYEKPPYTMKRSERYQWFSRHKYR